MRRVVVHGFGRWLAGGAVQIAIFALRCRRGSRPRWPLLDAILLGFEQRLDMSDRLFRTDVIVVFSGRRSG